MRHGLRILLGGLLAVGVAAGAALMLALEAAPRVPPRADVTVADVDRAVAIVRRQHPGRAAPGQPRWLALTERDADLLVGHAARRWLGGDAQVRQAADRLTVRASAPAPAGRWWNVELELRPTAGRPEVARLRVGRLPLPAALLAPAARAIAARQGVSADALDALEWIERVAWAPGRVFVVYRLDPEAMRQWRSALVAPVERERLQAYAARVAAASRAVDGHAVSLAALLPPVLALAAERSAGGGDPVAENRAALLVLTLYANQRPWRTIVPEADRWPQPRPLVVTLQQRHDFALHFLVSALIAAQAGTPLADAVGLWKEVDDARRGGSGFSFADLAADRAGTRFGELAVAEPRRLQARVAAGVAERDFMPEARDLPEGLPEAEFAARFGGVGGSGYARLLAEIDGRVDRLPMFR